MYKITFVGESGVGKSSIIQRFVSDEFKPNTPLTVAIDFCVKYFNCDGTKLILQLWDTAGQEKLVFEYKQYLSVCYLGFKIKFIYF